MGEPADGARAAPDAAGGGRPGAGRDESEDAGPRLARAAAQVAGLRRAIAADAALRAATGVVKRWQAARLARTHADLLADAATAPAARFFLDDLYGAKDFSRRDAELIRLLPTLTRLLPQRALHTVADAVELDALTEQLDEGLARALGTAAGPGLDEAAYARAYCQPGAVRDRAHQLDLVLRIGRSLDGLVSHPAIGRLLAAMALPARLAGVGQMHEFLSRGFAAFAGLPSAEAFLARIDRRERAIMAALLAGQDHDWINPPDSG
ncbi:MAG: hypothetical protein WCG13_13415 [Burkholderiales bacterium]